ncbi:MAG: 4-hydroxy-tetrahydrodipicolinate synthase [Acidimicrobiales bacterium]|nr:4-hydroxy-tetrahydrodipicolinate synthase [Acidimicrobiales bacterium]
MFGSTLTAMVTPFAEDSSLDLDAAQKLARYLVDHGNDGVVVAGTTGESATLTHDEQIDLIQAVVEALPDHPVIAGAGSNNTATAIEHSERCAAVGATALLHVTPYYNRPSQAGLRHHFSEVAKATDLPIVIYDIPGRTGRKISTELLLELFSIPTIVGLKDAAGSPAETANLIRRAHDADLDIAFYSGDDSLTLPLLAVGAIGVIGVATHWCGPEMAEMIAAFQKGDVQLAQQINAKLIPSWQFESTEMAPNPVPSKVIMNLLGVRVGECRSPMGPIPDGLLEEARALLSGLDR